MLNSDIIIYYTYSGIFLLAYFLGQYRKSTDKDEVESILKLSHIAMNKNSLTILSDFKDKLETVNSENTKLINEQNKQVVGAINRQVEVLNSTYKLLSEINLTLKEQIGLYERINMLQKIIVKKKNIGLK